MNESSNISDVAASASDADQKKEEAVPVEGMAMDISEPGKENVITNPQEYRLNFRTEAQNSEYTFSDDVSGFFSQLLIEAPDYENDVRQPVDIVAVLDVSGSMGGEKISLVRKSMRRLVRSLGSKDRVAFVTFDTNVQLILPFCELNEVNKEKALSIIGNIRSNSQTNLCGGVEEGIRQLLNHRVNEVAAVLLFTDGQANVGISSAEGIVKHVVQLVSPETQINPAEVEGWTVVQVCNWLNTSGLGMYQNVFGEQQVDGGILKNDLNADILENTLGVSKLHIGKFLRELEKIRGVNNQIEGQSENSTKMNNNNRNNFRLHTFGFGASHNEDLLQKLADSFDGTYFFMENEEGIKDGFANCMGGILTTVAQNIVVNIQFNPEVTDAKVYKDNVTENNGIYTVRFGDLQSEENRDILVSCNLPARQAPVEDYLLFEATYSYQNTWKIKALFNVALFVMVMLTDLAKMWMNQEIVKLQILL
jgi:hypothetical protein